MMGKIILIILLCFLVRSIDAQGVQGAFFPLFAE